MDIVDKIMDFENGSMSDEDIVAFFQELIDSGMAWSLQGSYGRMASALIEQGFCHPAAKYQGRQEQNITFSEKAQWTHRTRWKSSVTLSRQDRQADSCACNDTQDVSLRRLHRRNQVSYCTHHAQGLSVLFMQFYCCVQREMEHAETATSARSQVATWRTHDRAKVYPLVVRHPGCRTWHERL